MMDGNGLRDLDVSVLKSSGRRSAATNVDCCEMSRFFLSSDVFFFFLSRETMNSTRASVFILLRYDFVISFMMRFCHLIFFFLFNFLIF